MAENVSDWIPGTATAPGRKPKATGGGRGPKYASERKTPSAPRRYDAAVHCMCPNAWYAVSFSAGQ